MHTLVRILIVFGMNSRHLYNNSRGTDISVTLDHIRLPAGARLCITCDSSHLSCWGRKPVTYMTYIIIESDMRKIGLLCSDWVESAVDTTQRHIESCWTSHSLNYNSDKRIYGLKSAIWTDFSYNRRQKISESIKCTHITGTVMSLWLSTEHRMPSVSLSKQWKFCAKNCIS